MGSVRTPIMRRPRHLPQDRRATHRPTLDWDEPLWDEPVSTADGRPPRNRAEFGKRWLQGPLEVFDRLNQSLGKVDNRLPIKYGACQGDVGLTLLRVP